MEALAEIGEVFWMAACLTAIFVGFSLLTSLKFGLVFKVAIPVFLFLIGASMGACAGLMFSITFARAGAILLGLVGGIIGVSLSGKVKVG
jgi:hypothetical protein